MHPDPTTPRPRSSVGARALGILLMLNTGVALADPGDVHTTQRRRTRIREGPGAYFPLRFEAPSGTALTEKERRSRWLRVQAPSGEGWVAARALKAKAARGGSTMPKVSGASRTLTPTGVSAAIRGLARRSGVAQADALADVVGMVERPAFSAAEYATFVKESPRRGACERGLPEYDATIEEEGLGLAIASRVLHKRAVRDTPAARYVALLATSLAEASPTLDGARFSAFVVKDKVPNASSAPGGMVFVSTGLLDIIEDEAELAGVLAHEIMHVAARHGTTETVARKGQIEIDSRFAELDAEAGGAPDEAAVDTELTALFVQAYEFTVKPRAQSYELDADRLALTLLACAGYDLGGLPRVVRRIAQRKQELSEAGRDPFSRVDFKARVETMKAAIADAWPGGDESKHRARAARHLRGLRPAPR